MNIISLLYHYWQCKRLKFSNRLQLTHYQQHQWEKFTRNVLPKSPYFYPYLGKPLADFPLMNKQIMMDNFDQLNTAHLKLDEVLECALAAEHSRDFRPTLGKYSVGLSSGTSGKRGVFLVSPQEQAKWAGTILAKLLPNGLFHPERIAFFLRANNNLYNAVRSRTISFEFFDLFSSFEESIQRLITYQPSIIVAPAQVLYQLALDERLSNLPVKKVISVAEVLDPQTKALLQSRFEQVGEVYQATEGFLASTCHLGHLHLNEDLLIVEQEAIDEHRFIPIITDFSRSSQPIVRYRLDDVLVKHPDPCPCGSVLQRIEKIEGRLADTLTLEGVSQPEVLIFADVCERIFAQALPIDVDYQLDQIAKNQLKLTACCDELTLKACQAHFISVFNQLGVATDSLQWELSNQPISRTLTDKRRRIRNLSHLSANKLSVQ